MTSKCETRPHARNQPFPSLIVGLAFDCGSVTIVVHYTFPGN